MFKILGYKFYTEKEYNKVLYSKYNVVKSKQKEIKALNKLISDYEKQLEKFIYNK